jgi:threonine dehydratase
MLKFEDVVAAAARVPRFVSRTPLRPWEYLRRTLQMKSPVFLKLETLQNTGAFKVRGAANKLLHLVEGGNAPAHVVAASAGNHAQAVAYVAGRLGIPSTIVMPEGAPLVKVAATRDYGAEVLLHGSVYDDAFKKAQEILKERKGSVYVHAYEDPLVAAGQGTLGLEIHEQLLEADIHTDDIQVVIPIGGGGLIAGVATALRELRPKVKIFGVVGHAAQGMAESFKAGRVIDNVPGSSRRSKTLGEGLAVKKVSEMTFAVIRREVAEIAIVDDDEMARAIAALMERGKLVVEGSGAAGVAAALAGKFNIDLNKPIVFVLCGGNIDMNLVSNILERGLTKDGRWLRLRVNVEDKPGELAKLTSLIAELGANVLEVTHDRTSSACRVGSTLIHFQLETRGLDHVEEIRSLLVAKGYVVDVL